MWMTGYNDGGDLYMSDSINAGRKLRPLIPRPLTPATTSNPVSTPPCLNRIHGGADHVFSLNGSIATMSEQNKRDFNPQQVVVSSRWNPTPEQLRALEELYRRGTRTPSADQIQHITAQLRRYGKIEGKNVFYWFQNHKARERQKRRREMESDDQSNRDVEILERKETGGASRTVFGVDQHTTKNWPSSINSSTIPEESAVCIQKAAKAAGGGSSEAAECKSSEHHQWMKMDDRIGGGGGGRRELESQQLRRNDTWQAMQLSNYPAPTYHINTPKPPVDPKAHHLFNKPANNCNVINPHLTPFLISSRPPPPQLHQAYNIGSDEEDDRDHHHFRHHHFIINNHFINGDHEDDDDDDNSQTLELFPLRSGNSGYDNGNEKESEMSFAAINNGFTTPHQFFEFLPLKN